MWSIWWSLCTSPARFVLHAVQIHVFLFGCIDAFPGNNHLFPFPWRYHSVLSRKLPLWLAIAMLFFCTAKVVEWVKWQHQHRTPVPRCLKQHMKIAPEDNISIAISTKNVWSFSCTICVLVYTPVPLPIWFLNVCSHRQPLAVQSRHNLVCKI